MRDEDERSGSLFSYVDLEVRVRQNHPLRSIRAIVNEALTALESDFSALYSPIGRPLIPPEKLDASIYGVVSAVLTSGAQISALERGAFFC